MPTDLFDWGARAGLMHHCPICDSPLRDPKAKTRCLGVHVEWCHRYHTLFRKNWSSRCSACRIADEQHEKRHQEIAKILHNIRQHRTGQAGANITHAQTLAIPLQARNLNIVPGHDSVSVGGPTSNKRDRKAAKKSAKAGCRSKVLTSSDIALVASTMHPEDDMLDFDQQLEDVELKLNLSFVSSVSNIKEARMEFLKKDSDQDGDIDSDELNRILTAFEVHTEVSGIEGELVRDLTDAITRDLKAYRDEMRNLAELRNGFWRWANNKAFRSFSDNGRAWDDKCDIRSNSAIDELAEHPELDRQGAVVEDAQADSVEAEDTSSGTVGSDESLDDSISSIASTRGRGQRITGRAPKSMKTPIGTLKLISNGGLAHFTVVPNGHKYDWSDWCREDMDACD